MLSSLSNETKKHHKEPTNWSLYECLLMEDRKMSLLIKILLVNLTLNLIIMILMLLK